MKLSTWKNMVIGLLILLNLGVLSTVWFGHRSDMRGPETEQQHFLPGNRPGQGPHDRNPEARPIDRVMVETLGLNDQQSKAFQDLKEYHQQASTVLRQEIHQLKEASFKAISVGDREEAERLASDIGGLHAEMELLLFGHFSEVRALCTEDQVARFDEMLSRIGQRIHPGPPPGRGPRH